MSVLPVLLAECEELTNAVYLGLEKAERNVLPTLNNLLENR